MFNLVRIVVLIACAYAGSVVAQMQISQSPDAVSVPQP